VVVLGHSDAHTPAGKVSRDDVAELITAAMFHPAAAGRRSFPFHLKLHRYI